MSEDKVQNKYIEQDPPLADSPQLDRKNNDYLAYLKEKLNFILATYGRRLTSVNGDINELTRTASETTSRISNAEGEISSISQRADNIELAVAGTDASLSSIGGRNYWWSLDPKIHPDVTLTNVTVTYNEADNGKYVVKCSQATSSFAQALFPASIIPVPAELIGKKMILHADYIAASGTNDARVFIIIADSNGSQISATWLTTSETSKTFTVPNGAVSFRPLIRVRQTGSTAVNESVTVRGIKLERGDVKTDWSPAPEDSVNGGNIISKINVSTEGVTIAANKISLNGTTIVNGKLISTTTRTFNHNDYSNADLTIIQELIVNRSWTASDLDKYDINMDGELSLLDLLKVRNMVLNGTDESATITCEIDPSKSSMPIVIYVNNSAEPYTYLNGTQVVGKGGNFKYLRAQNVDGNESGNTFHLDTYGLTFCDSNGNITASYGNTLGSLTVADTGEVIKSESIREVDCSTSVNTNTHWYYRKWRNGDYECWTTIKYGASDLGQFTAGTVNNPETWAFAEGGGKLYLRTLPALQYPVTFDEAPHETVSVSGCSSSDASWHGSSFWIIPFGAGTGNTTTRTGKYHCVRPSNFSNGIVYTIYVMGKVTV